MLGCGVQRQVGEAVAGAPYAGLDSAATLTGVVALASCSAPPSSPRPH